MGERSEIDEILDNLERLLAEGREADDSSGRKKAEGCGAERDAGPGAASTGDPMHMLVDEEKIRSGRGSASTPRRLLLTADMLEDDAGGKKQQSDEGEAQEGMEDVDRILTATAAMDDAQLRALARGISSQLSQRAGEQTAGKEPGPGKESMSKQATSISSSYDPRAVEPAVSEQWLNSNAFAPAEAKESFCIVIPPPNVTGTLHMGHAFSYTLQDILIRWQRMQGKSTLWQPGTDHAGIATQMVVERLLAKEGLDRRTLGREKFLDRVWEWKEKYGGAIIHQLKRLGCSCDWSRERFTLDEGLSRAVREVFVRLYEEGLIYRGKRLVNWDPVLETAVSDLEVVHEEETGCLWHICYPLDGGEEDGREHVIVATTRPETMLGDTAVAVHPEDLRYKHLIGRKVRVPLCGRSIPIIADSHVDPNFGTGCVKITPAHDFNDYEIGERHHLPLLNIFTPRAHIVDAEFIPEKYRGMERYEAREHIVADLDAEGLLHKIEEHVHPIGRGDRSHAVLEPYLTDQWFVDIKPLAEPAIAAVEKGEIRFIPGHWAKTYFEWMRNIQDWCISRQLWWGHRIPAWYCNRCDHITVARETPECCEGCGGTELSQDEDVLDTWFSSGLWPFSTLGWPARTRELETFYPTDVLVTGFDIIFFWVARMIMLGLKFTGQVPFRDVYIHALIRDAEGQKMSKSKGNVVDPLDMVERFGADALRFTLAHMATPGRDIKLDVGRIAANRHFMNKIWNAARFVFLNRTGARTDPRIQPASDLNRWLLFELDACRGEVDKALREYRFHEAAATLYAFIWGVYCDWYLEAAKVALDGEDEEVERETRTAMLTALDGWLRLLHPICPHITEALWQGLHGDEARLVTAAWPSGRWNGDEYEQAAGRFRRVKDVVAAIRSIRGEMNIAPGRRIRAAVACDDAARGNLETHRGLILNLARLEELQWLAQNEELHEAAVAPLAGMTVYVPLAGLVDVDEEVARLQKVRNKLDKEIERLETRLGNPQYRQKAPAEIVAAAAAELEDLRRRRAEIEESITRMQPRKQA